MQGFEALGRTARPTWRQGQAFVSASAQSGQWRPRTASAVRGRTVLWHCRYCRVRRQHRSGLRATASDSSRLRLQHASALLLTKRYQRNKVSF